jgi:type IV secretory pathway TrbL component
MLMFTTPPATPLITGRNSGRSCGRHAVALAVTAAAAAGQIGAAAQENTSFGKVPVQLAAGGTAHAWLQVAEAGNYPAATCQPVTAHWLRVYAPGETQAVYVSHAFDACASASTPLLTVMPVRSGQGVQGTTP